MGSNSSQPIDPDALASTQPTREEALLVTQSMSETVVRETPRVERAVARPMAKRSAPDEPQVVKRQRKAKEGPETNLESQHATARRDLAVPSSANPERKEAGVSKTQSQRRRPQTKSAEFITNSDDEDYYRPETTSPSHRLGNTNGTDSKRSGVGRIPDHILQRARDHTLALSQAAGTLTTTPKTPPRRNVKKDGQFALEQREISATKKLVSHKSEAVRKTPISKGDEHNADIRNKLSVVRTPPARNALAVDSSQRASLRKRMKPGREDEPDAELDSTVARRPNADSKLRKTEDFKKGAFSEVEKESAHQAYLEACRLMHCNEEQMNDQIHEWSEASVFRALIVAALPLRDTRSIRKFCQRRYHNFKNGAWSNEDETLLREAVETHGSKWGIVAGEVNRAPEECRVRWRDYSKHNGTRTVGPWSAEEEDRLLATIKTHIAKLKRANKSSAMPDDADLEGSLDWAAICNQLGNVRNPRQCRKKYSDLKQRKERAGPASDPANGHAQGQEQALRTKNHDSAARKHVSQFELGDFYDVFREIHTSFADPDVSFHDEDNVVYSTVALKNPDSRFNHKHLRRVALDVASKWDQIPPAPRKRLTKAKSAPAKARVLAQWVESSYEPDKMARSYRTALIGRSRKDHAMILSQLKYEAQQASNGVTENEKKRRRNKVAKDGQAGGQASDENGISEPTNTPSAKVSADQRMSPESGVIGDAGSRRKAVSSQVPIKAENGEESDVDRDPDDSSDDMNQLPTNVPASQDDVNANVDVVADQGAISDHSNAKSQVSEQEQDSESSDEDEAIEMEHTPEEATLPVDQNKIEVPVHAGRNMGGLAIDGKVQNPAGADPTRNIGPIKQMISDNPDMRQAGESATSESSDDSSTDDESSEPSSESTTDDDDDDDEDDNDAARDVDVQMSQPQPHPQQTNPPQHLTVPKTRVRAVSPVAKTSPPSVFPTQSQAKVSTDDETSSDADSDTDSESSSSSSSSSDGSDSSLPVQSFTAPNKLSQSSIAKASTPRPVGPSMSQSSKLQNNGRGNVKGQALKSGRTAHMMPGPLIDGKRSYYAM